MFDISIKTVVLRYYLMMFVVIFGLFTSPWIMLLALPIFLITILGVRLTKRETVVKTAVTKSIAKSKQMPQPVRKAG